MTGRFRLRVRPAADADIDEIARRIARDNLAAAQRFDDAVWDAFEKLGGMPGIGAIREIDNVRLRGLRSWVITGFDQYLILYLPIERGIEVVRVLHGARDVNAILEAE
jgi:toxin ParE1/3/4